MSLYIPHHPTFAGSFKKGDKVGDGSYSTIFSIIDEDKKDTSVVKVYSKKVLSDYRIPIISLREISIHLLLGDNIAFVPKIKEIYFGDTFEFTMHKMTHTLTYCILNKMITPINMKQVIFNIVYCLAYAQSNMILHREFLEAKKIVDEYNLQTEQSVLNVNNLSIDQKVKRNYPQSWNYWVSEIQGEDVLIRTTEKEDDPEYNDFLVNISDLRPS